MIYLFHNDIFHTIVLNLKVFNYHNMLSLSFDNIAPAKEVIFRQDPLPNGDQVNVSCAATGIFPQPQIKLLRGS